MRKLSLLLVVIAIAVAACQVSTTTPAVPAMDTPRDAIPPPATRSPTPIATATTAATPTSAAPAPTTVASPAPSPCATLSISLPMSGYFASVPDAGGAIAYSNDGLMLAFPESGATVAVHPLGGEAREADRSFAWSPDGRRIAFVHALSGPPLECELGYLMLADLECGEVHLLAPGPEVYGQPAWSPDGEQLAFVRVTQPGFGELTVLHLASNWQSTLGERASPWQWLAPAWLDDEHVLYARCSEADPQRLELVSQPLGKGEPRIVAPAAETFGLRTFAFSPAARQVVYNCGSYVVLTDVDTGTTTSIGVVREVTMLQWAPSGQLVLGYAGLGELHLARVGPPSTVVRLDVDGVPGQGQTWSPDGRRFAVLVDAEGEALPHLNIYDVDGQALESLGIAVGRPWDIAWNPRASTAITTLGHGQPPGPRQAISLAYVRLLAIDPELPQAAKQVNSLAFSPDGQLLAAGSADGKVYLWRAATGELPLLRRFARVPPSKVYLWRAATGELLHALGGQTSVDAIAFTPDGSLLIAGSGSLLRFWDPVSGELVREVPAHPGVNCGITGLAVSPDGQRLATIGNDGLLKLWDVTSGDCLYALPGGPGWVWGVAFSADGEILATGGSFVCLRRASSGELLARFTEGRGQTYCLAFRPGGQQLVAGGYGLSLWDASTGECLHRFRCVIDDVRSLALSADGRIAATAGSGSSRLYDLDGGFCLGRLDDPLTALVALSPDGRLLASVGCCAGTIKLWAVGPDAP